jgi:hypothetical protein
VARDQRPIRICPATAAFDTDKRGLEPLAAAGSAAVVLLRQHRREPRHDDRQVYWEWHLIDREFILQNQRVLIRHHTAPHDRAAYSPLYISLSPSFG